MSEHLFDDLLVIDCASFIAGPAAATGALVLTSPGAAVDMATFLCEGSASIYAANMLLWGPGHFTSSAIAMATVVRQLLEGVFRA